MRSFKKFIKEGVGAGGSPAVGTTDQNLAVDFNINPSAVQEPEIVKKLNAFIGAVANARYGHNKRYYGCWCYFDQVQNC